MTYRHLGQSGLRVSTLGIGTGGHDPLGQKSGRSQSEMIGLLHRAFDLGVNLFDTAPGYMESEAILGRALETLPRQEIVVSTKLGLAPAGEDNELFVSPNDVAPNIDRSLQRLGLDHIDVLLVTADLKHFRIATRLDPETWFVPIRTPEATFTGLVEQALDGLSPQIKEALDNVSVVVEPWPSADELRGERLSPLIVGLFSGPSRDSRNTEDPWSHMPAQIAIYQRNLEYTCPSHNEMVEQLKITLWHEIGHWLGLSEEDLHDRGLG